MGAGSGFRLDVRAAAEVAFFAGAAFLRFAPSSRLPILRSEPFGEDHGEFLSRHSTGDCEEDLCEEDRKGMSGFWNWDGRSTTGRKQC
jgi:hypothetical protein